MIQYCPTSIILEDTIKKALFETWFYFPSRGPKGWYDTALVKKWPSSTGFPSIKGTVLGIHALDEHQLKTVKNKWTNKTPLDSYEDGRAEASQTQTSILPNLSRVKTWQLRGRRRRQAARLSSGPQPKHSTIPDGSSSRSLPAWTRPRVWTAHSITCSLVQEEGETRDCILIVFNSITMLQK